MMESFSVENKHIKFSAELKKGRIGRHNSITNIDIFLSKSLVRVFGLKFTDIDFENKTHVKVMYED